MNRALAVLALLSSMYASAATTATWEMNNYADFLKGRFSGVALDRDGRLSVAPQLTTVFSSGQPAIWSVAAGPDGSVYAGTGHRGRVYRIAPGGTSSLLWTADEPEVFAVAVDGKGTLYAGSSPDGKVFRIGNGKAQEIFAPKAKYIWALAIARDGSVFVGTGNPGSVYRIDPAGKAELFYDTGQLHVTSLAVDSQGRLLAGTEPNGTLYRIDMQKHGFVLYDAGLPEIRTIVPMPNGDVYAAALGGALSATAGAATSTPITIAPMSITVTASASGTSATPGEGAIPAQTNPDQLKPKATVTPQAATPTTAATATAAPAEIAGVDKSALYKINADNTVETIWTSKEENLYDFLVSTDGQIVLATDVGGRIYRLGTDRKPSLLAQTSEGEATRLLSTPAGIIAATVEMGKLFRLFGSNGSSGWYESPVHDAGAIARWGRVNWRDRKGGIRMETRSGNVARPDRTWSDWAVASAEPGNALIASPNARYIQWRAQFTDSAAYLESVSLAYLPQNTPPIVRSISVSTVASSAAKTTSAAATTGASSAYSVTVTDTGEAAPTTSTGSPTQVIAKGAASQLQVSWQADDPDGDKLAYTLMFRAEEGKQWIGVRNNVFENSILFDSDVLADGRYFFRVIATDRPSNPAEFARKAELISTPVLVDNTPPDVQIGKAVRDANTIRVDLTARDATSTLRRCEYSYDAGPWMPVEAADGVTDSLHESFHVSIDGVRPGEHLLVVRVFDSAGNAGLAKTVVH